MDTPATGTQPAPASPDPLNNPTEPILQYFAHSHLPPHLAMVSRPFYQLAIAIVYGDNVPESGPVTFGGPLPRNPERSVALRKLLEAKDAAVRAALTKA